MSNAASVIVTLGAILLMLIGMNQSNINSGNSYDTGLLYVLALTFSGLAFIGCLVGYAVGHWRGKDEASSAIVYALLSALGLPLLVGIIALLLRFLGFFK